MKLFRKQPASLFVVGLILIQVACASSLAAPMSPSAPEPTALVFPTIGSTALPVIVASETPTGLMPAPITLVPATVVPTVAAANPQSTSAIQRIRFATGATSATVSGN